MKTKFVLIASLFFVFGLIFETETSKSQIDSCWIMTCENDLDKDWGYFHNPDSVKFDSCKCTREDLGRGDCKFIYAKKYFIFGTLDTFNIFGSKIYRDTISYDCNEIIDKFYNLRNKLIEMEQKFGKYKICQLPNHKYFDLQYKSNAYYIYFYSNVNIVELEKEIDLLPDTYKGGGYISRNCQYLSVNEYKDLPYTISPQPLNGSFLSIISPNSSIISLNIKISSLIGKIVFEEHYQSNSGKIYLDLSCLSNGFYFIIINDNTYSLIIER